MSERLRMVVDPDGNPTAHKVVLTTQERAGLAHEAAMLRAAAHPGVVRLVDADDDHLVLAWTGGRSLATHPVRPLRHLVAVTVTVATTLADLHQLGLTHGSVEPGHILLGPQGQPLLASFGAAQQASSPVDPDHQERCARDVADLGHVIEWLLEISGCGPGEADSLGRRLQNHRPRKAVAALARRAHRAPANLRPSARALADELTLLVPDARLAAPATKGGSGASPTSPAPDHEAVTDDPATSEAALDGRAVDEAPIDQDGLGKASVDDRVEAEASADGADLEMAPVDEPLVGDPGTEEPAAEDPADPVAALWARIDQREEPSPMDRRPRRNTVLATAAVACALVVLLGTWIAAVDTPAASHRDGVDLGASDSGEESSPNDSETSETSDPAGTDRSSPRPTEVAEHDPVDGAPPTITPAVPVAGCPWDPTAPDSPAGVDAGLDCDEPVVDGNLVQVGERRFEVGTSEHVVVVGDWWCRQHPTPALLHPPSGEVFVFDRWAPPGGELDAMSVAIISGAVALHADPDGACDQLVARTDSDATVHIPVPPPPDTAS